jgi:hypothetical protein
VSWGHAIYAYIAYVVRCRLHTAKVWTQFQGKPWGICDGQSSVGALPLSLQIINILPMIHAHPALGTSTTGPFQTEVPRYCQFWKGIKLFSYRLQKLCWILAFRSQNSPVGIATGRGLHGKKSVFESRQWKEFSYKQRQNWLWSPPSFLPRALSTGVKRQGREADRIQIPWTFSPEPAVIPTELFRLPLL